MDYIYLVKYSDGDWDYYKEYDLFVSNDIDLVHKYVLKFNKKLERLQKIVSEHYKIYGEDAFYRKWFFVITNTNEAFYKKIIVK